MSDVSITREEEELFHAAVARMRAGVMAVIFAMVTGGGFFVATVWLLIRGGPNVGSHLGLLRHYFPGYTVTWMGSFVGLFYGMIVGGITGWWLTWVYNRVTDRRR